MFDRYKDKKLVIWGTGKHAAECLSILKQQSLEVSAFCDNNPDKWGDFFEGISVISPADFRDLCSKENVHLIVGNSYYKEIQEQVRDFHCVAVEQYQDLYKCAACGRISDIYRIPMEKMEELVEENKEVLSDAFDDDILYKVRLEQMMFDLCPELKPCFNLSVCAIIKNEGDYILEWIKYHQMVGVDHFYIYDNESTDGLYELIKDYIDKNIVTYIPFPGKVRQMAAYTDAMKTYRMESKYIAFIDADEFLVPVKEENVFEVVDRIFCEHPLAGGIGVNWRIYGTSFHEEQPAGYVIENYKYRAEDFHPVNSHIKTICNPRRSVGFPGDPHAAGYMEPYHCISENGSLIPGAFFYDGIGRKLRLNHYFTKSKEEFWAKRIRGRADIQLEHTEEMIEQEFLFCQSYNEVYDDIMDQWILKLKDSD